MSFLSYAFGKALRLARKRQNLSQAAAASSIGVETATISRWESGEFLPTNDKADQALKALSVSGEEFIGMMLGKEPEASDAPTLSEVLELLNNYVNAESSLRQEIRYILGLQNHAGVDALLASERGQGLHPAKAQAPKASK